METSSPLAAMRPAPPAFGQRGLFGSRAVHLAPSAFAASSRALCDQFNFQRPSGDYFNIRTIQGSSPTGSLAADLSQNFKLNDARLVACPAGLSDALTLIQCACVAVQCFPRHGVLCSPLLP